MGIITKLFIKGFHQSIHTRIYISASICFQIQLAIYQLHLPITKRFGIAQGMKTLTVITESKCS